MATYDPDCPVQGAGMLVSLLIAVALLILTVVVITWCVPALNEAVGDAIDAVSGKRR